MAQKFNESFGDSSLPIWFSGEWASDDRHATGQAQIQSRGAGYKQPTLINTEDRGFIGLTYFTPNEKKSGVFVHGDASRDYRGFRPEFMLKMDREAQRLAVQQSNRPIIDVEFSLLSALDIGAFISFAQTSAALCGMLAKEKVPLATLPEREMGDLEKHVIEENGLSRKQNILNFNDDGTIGGVLGSKIQKESFKEHNYKSLDHLINVMTRLVTGNAGIEKILKNLDSVDKLIHLDPEIITDEMNKSISMAERFKKYKKIYVAAIGGSVTGDFLLRTLNMTGGPEVVYITSYDGDSLKKIEKDIQDHPDKIGIVQISKSGVTPEVDVNGSAMMDTQKAALVKKGRSQDDIKEHWLFITDPQLGDLRERVREEGYLSIDHSEHGGRFSMFSALGLFFYFLKSENQDQAREEINKAIKTWDQDIKKLTYVKDEIKKVFNKDSILFKIMNKKHDEVSLEDRKAAIGEMKQIFKLIEGCPGVTEGVLHTLMNTFQKADPELQKDTEIALTLNTNKAQIVSPHRPFYQQIKVESLGKPGVRYYSVPVAGRKEIEGVLPRIINNRRAYVTLYGETGNDSEEAEREAIYKDLSEHEVPAMEICTEPSNIQNLASMMRMAYVELAVAASLYAPMDVDSEGQPGVQLAKDVFRSINAEVNKAIRKEGNDVLEEAERAEKRHNWSKTPKIKQEDIEAISEQPINIEQAFNSTLEGAPKWAPLVNKIILGPGTSGTDAPLGLLTLGMRDKLAYTEVPKIQGMLRENIEGLIDGDDKVGELIIDGEYEPINSGRDKWIVRATSIETPFNLVNGTANGTSIDVFEKDEKNNLKLAVTVHIQWSAGGKHRVLVSNGLRTQDYELRDDGRVVELSKASENNYMRMAKFGDFVSLGGATTGKPEGLRLFEEEVILPSKKFKVRHSDAVTPDVNLMMNKQGLYTGWVSLGEAVGITALIEAAGGRSMYMTGEGFSNVKDIKITEEMLKKDKQIYICCGVNNLIQQLQVWMDFLNVYKRVEKKDEKDEKYEEYDLNDAPVFKMIEVLDGIGENAKVQLRAQAVMLLCRIKEGLDALPDARLLRGQVKDLVGILRERIKMSLENLKISEIIKELRDQYLLLSDEERKKKENLEKYALLGYSEADLRAYAEPGEQTKTIYELEKTYECQTSWELMQAIKNNLEGNIDLYSAFESAQEDLKERYDKNAISHEKEREPGFPDMRFQETTDEYWENNMRIPDSASIPENVKGALRDSVVDVCKTILDAYTKPIELTGEGLDKDQRDILDDLNRKEHDLFYEGSDGKKYIRSMEWIIRNIHESKVGANTNESGDVSSRLDEIFNNIYKYLLRQKVRAIISEEDTTIVYGTEEQRLKEEEKLKGYQLVLFLDPIDGSSQIKDGGPFGSIFTIGFLRPDQTLEEGSFNTRTQVLQGFHLTYSHRTSMMLLNPCNSQNKAEVVQFGLTRDDSGERVFRKELTYKSLLQCGEYAETFNNWNWLLPNPDPRNSNTAIWLALGGSFSTA